MSNLVYLAEARFPDGRTLSELLELPVTESYSRTKECWETVCERLGLRRAHDLFNLLAIGGNDAVLRIEAIETQN
jgi:hypothetical protein